MHGNQRQIAGLPPAALSTKARFGGPLLAQTSIGRLAQPLPPLRRPCDFLTTRSPTLQQQTCGRSAASPPDPRRPTLHSPHHGRRGVHGQSRFLPAGARERRSPTRDAEGTEREHERGHAPPRSVSSVPLDPVPLRDFRARGAPRLPSRPASELNAKEGVGGPLLPVLAWQGTPREHRDIKGGPLRIAHSWPKRRSHDWLNHGERT